MSIAGDRRPQASLRHAMGDGEDFDPTLPGQLSSLFDELADADAEHGDVAVIHDVSHWCLSAHRGGTVILEHLDNGGPRHLRNVSKSRTMELWALLIHEDMDALFAEPWLPGYF